MSEKSQADGKAGAEAFEKFQCEITPRGLCAELLVAQEEHRRQGHGDLGARGSDLSHGEATGKAQGVTFREHQECVPGVEGRTKGQT